MTAKSHTQVSSAPRVLVVDDDPVVIRAMQTLMTRAGFNPITALTGKEALAKALGTEGEAPVAAVVDIHLPDINGLKLAQLLRKSLGPRTPIIILSGDNSMDIIRALPEHGANWFISKPVNGRALIAQLKQMLALPS